MSLAPAVPPDELSGFLGASGRAPGEPYRGLEPFGFADAGILAAREAEIERLVRLVTMYRGVLLYGESGAGKSSIVNAGLLPRLVQEGFWPHRVRVQPREDQELVLEPIRASEDASLPLAFDGTTQDGRLVLGAKDFPAAVDEATKHGRIVLVFDQFEELVTLFDEASAAPGAQARVVDAVVRLLRNRDVRVKLVFVFREDYLASLEPLLAEQPELADQSLRLVLPPVESAQQIIRTPFERFADAFPRELDPELADRIAASLAHRSRGTGLNLSELQVVCRRLWEADDPAALLASRGVEGLLEDFLNERLLAFDGGDGDLAVALLTRLVTTSGTRNVVSRDDLLAGTDDEDGPDAQSTERILARLEHEAHLIRSERRRDVTTFEIVSEFLVPMIARRKAERRSTVEAERALARAAERHREELAARQRTLRRVGAAVGLVVVAILTIVTMYALAKRDDAEKQRRQAVQQRGEAVRASNDAASARDSAKAHELAASAEGVAQGDPVLARKLALKALQYGWTPGGENALRGAVPVASPSLTLSGSSSMSAGCCVFTRDGRFIVASTGGALRMWDASTGAPVTTVKQSALGNGGPILRPDGHAVLVKVSRKDKDVLREVSLSPRQRSRAFRGAGEGAFFANGSYSPDGSKVVLPSRDGHVRVFSTRTHRVLSTINVPLSRLLEDAFLSKDGRVVVTAGLTGYAQAWALPSGRLNWSLPRVRRVIMAPRGHLVAIVRWNGRTELRDARDGRLVREVGGSKFATDLAVFASDGRTLAVRARRGRARSARSVRVLTVPGMRSLGTVSAGAPINAVALRSDGRLLATAQAGGAVLWDVRSGAALAHLGAGAAASSVAFSADGSRLVTGSADGQVRVWKLDEIRSHVALAATRAHDVAAGSRRRDVSHSIWSTAFSPQGDRVAMASEGGIVTIAKVPSGRRVRTLRVSPGWSVWMVAFSPDGRLLATASDLDQAVLWDASSGKRLRTVRTAGTPSSVAFAPDGREFATAGFGLVEVWSTSSKKRLQKFSASVDAPLEDAVFSRDGRQVAAASDGDRVYIWDRRSGRLIHTLETGSGDDANVVAYSGDGRYLAEGTSSGEVIVWNARTGRRAATLVGHKDSARMVLFMHDGRHLLSAGQDGTVRVWDLRAGIGAVVASSIVNGASVDLSPDARWLSLGTAGHAGLVQECPGCGSLDALKSLARATQRGLTKAEEQKYLHKGELDHPTPFG